MTGLALALRVARDSIPPLRFTLLVDVSKHPQATTTDVTRRVQKPRTTVDRALQELHLLGLLAVEGSEAPDPLTGKGKAWRYSLTGLVDTDALDQLRHQKWLPHSLLSPRGVEQQSEQAADRPGGGVAISGEPPDEPYREPAGLVRVEARVDDPVTTTATSNGAPAHQPLLDMLAETLGGVVIADTGGPT